MSVKVGGQINKGFMSGKATRDVLAAALTTSQIFEAPVLQLVTAAPELNADMLLSDFTLATNLTPLLVTGITFATPTWEGDDAQVACVDSANTFTYDGSGTAPTIVGMILTDGETSTANVLYAEIFDTPVTVDDTVESLTVIPVLPLRPQQR